MGHIIKYYWSKLIKKLPGSSIRNVVFEKPSKAEARCTIINSSFGRYSYCGYNCTIINCSVGRFTSIADKVTVGISHHPIEWSSTSPAFYFGKDSIPKHLAKMHYNSNSQITTIGNDVWISEGVFIKDGLKIGDGSVIAMGSVVTKDVPPYAIVAGNPARMIKMRFNQEMIEKFQEIKWWNFDVEKLRRLAEFFHDPNELINNIERGNY